MVAAGPRQDFDGWHQLATAVASEIRTVSSAFNPAAVSQILIALVLMALLAYELTAGREEIARLWWQMLRM